MTILYFTATGNGLYIAKSLGGETLSIPQMIKQNTWEFADDKIGIIFPIYSNKVPPYIEEFILKATFNTPYLFAIMTYGIYDGAAPDHLVAIAQKAKVEFSYINTIKMVDNWIPGFKMESQIKSEPKKEIDKHIELIRQDLEGSKKWILGTSMFDRMVTNHWVKRTHKPNPKGSTHGYATGLGIKNVITVEDTCTGCGTCAKVCPVDNILVDRERKTISLGNTCIACFACTHNCPTNSIRMKGERSRTRFRNSHISLKEIIQSNK